MKSIKIAARIICFITLLCGTLFLCTKLMMPTWLNFNNDDTVKQFYREPPHSIETLFLGTSQVVNGISPIELYDRFGISSYNLASQLQPMLSSYYWLLEAHRIHSHSLRYIVLDPSYMFRGDERGDESSMLPYNEIALTHMAFSTIKSEALEACSEQYSSFSYIENLIPLLRYHSRWKELSSDDFRSVTNTINRFYTRGQNITYDRMINTSPAEDMPLPRWDLTSASDYEEYQYTSLWTPKNQEYFIKIVSFCRNNNLKLILLKLPKNWNDHFHDAFDYLGRKYFLPIIDMNKASLQKEMGVFLPLDQMDDKHANIYGAIKYTDYIGKYLTTHYSCTDVRTVPEMQHLKEQSNLYYKMRQDGWLQNIQTLKAYCAVVAKDRYTIFAAANGESSRYLTDNDRQALYNLGFLELANLKYDHSYAGVRDKGTVVADLQSSGFRDTIFIQGHLDFDGYLTISDILSAKNDTAGNIVTNDEEDLFQPAVGSGFFSIESSSRNSSNKASIIINGDDYSDEINGIHFVVFNHETRMIVDSSVFVPTADGFDTRRYNNINSAATYRKRMIHEENKYNSRSKVS